MKYIYISFVAFIAFIACNSKETTLVENYDNGNVSNVKKIKIVNGDSIIEEKQYFENGTLMYEMKKINGDKHGNYVSYHPNGALKEKGEYINDSIRIIELYIDIKEDTLLKNGNGYLKLYFNNGNIYYEGLYKDGLKEGIHISYQYEGGIDFQEYYVNGKKEDEYVEFDENGDTTLTISYKHNYPIEIKYYTEDTLPITIDRFK